MTSGVVTTIELTSDEDTFALAVLECGGNLGAAYRQVFGQDVTNPSARARLLMTRPEIAKRIHQLQLAVEDSALISLGSHLEKLSEIRDISMAMGQMKTALGAERSRGEAAGFYVDKSKGKGPIDPSRPLVQVTINSTPPNVQEWAARHGTAPVVVEG